MRVRVSTTIPTSRQYENIKTEYEGELSEREQMINMAQEDLRKLNGLCKTPDLPQWMIKPKEGESCLMGNVEYYFDKGEWKFRKKGG